MSNMSFLGGGLYIVRTQAGFNQALRHFHAPDSAEDVRGYPTAYPSMVHLASVYNGNIYTRAECFPLNEIKAAIEASEASRP